MRAKLAGVLVVACMLGVFSHSAEAQVTSYHLANPVGSMYDLPVGEAPGWSTGTWFNIEIGASNIWNKSFSMTDTRNGNIYTYFADFEEEMAVAEFGQAITDDLAVSVEVPYANHNGGFMDAAIDQFHVMMGDDRFDRDTSPMFGNHFNIQTNGVNNLATEHAEGAGNIKAKLKYWFWHLQSPTPGACDCGMAISGQVKFPLQTREHGLSSGHNDYSGLIHFGLPINESSAFWTTAAFTKLGSNDTFDQWPMRVWQQMYEADLDIGLTDHFGLIVQARVESPLFDKNYLSFNYTTTSPNDQINERINSGWNALVDWRGSEDIGFRWRWGQGSQANFLFIEDWNLGGEDQTGDNTYINNAPDFTLMTQLHFVF